jgi:hypothetical protein
MSDDRAANDPAPPDRTAEGASAGEAATPARDLDAAQARLAYSIIQSLLEHTRVTSDLVALMAQAFDPEALDALTNTPHWAAYLDSRRALERTREEIERFAEAMTKLSETMSAER